MTLASADTAQYANHGRPARGEFARQLSALHRDAGAPSLRHVATLAQQRARNTEGGGRSAVATAQRISDWMNGRNVPARFESLVPVLHVLAARARRRSGTPPVSLRAWRSLWAAARRAPAAASDTTTQPPYPNADELPEGQEPAFFGRQRAIGSILEMVRASASSQRDADAMVLTGASGIGKTALLQAGVIPALSTESTRWRVVVTTPDRDALRSLARIFCATDRSSTPEPDLDAVQRWAGDRRLLLIIDQFEQLYQPDVDATVRERFLIWLKHVSTIGSVLVAVRSDQLTSCSQHPWLAKAVQHNSLTLNPPSRQELMSAIVDPPRTRGVTVDPAAAELLITELEGSRPGSDDPTVGAGVLPVLSATMRSMWAGHSGHRLELAAYHRVGGVAGVIGRIAEQTWEALTSGEQLDARHILLALVTVHRDGTITRCRTPNAELAHIAARTNTGPDLVHLALMVLWCAICGYYAHAESSRIAWWIVIFVVVLAAVTSVLTLVVAHAVPAGTPLEDHHHAESVRFYLAELAFFPAACACGAFLAGRAARRARGPLRAAMSLASVSQAMLATAGPLRSLRIWGEYRGLNLPTLPTPLSIVIFFGGAVLFVISFGAVGSRSHVFGRSCLSPHRLDPAADAAARRPTAHANRMPGSAGHTEPPTEVRTHVARMPRPRPNRRSHCPPSPFGKSTRHIASGIVAILPRKRRVPTACQSLPAATYALPHIREGHRLYCRSDLMGVLTEFASTAKADIKYDVPITDVDPVTGTIYSGARPIVCDDSVIAADGIDSIARTRLEPDRTPEYGGQVVFYGTTDGPIHLPSDPEILHFHGHLGDGVLPTSSFGYLWNNDAAFWFARLTQQSIPEQDICLHPTGGVADDIRGAAPAIPEIIDSLLTKTEHVHISNARNVPFAEARTPQLPLILCGDADHAITPAAARGAREAIEDAATIYHAILEGADPAAAGAERRLHISAEREQAESLYSRARASSR